MMNTDERRYGPKRILNGGGRGFPKMMGLFVFLSLFINFYRWPNGIAFASSVPTPGTDAAFEAAAKALDKAKAEVQELKDAWDRARLETTLYDQRAKRAYQKWAKSAKSAREKAKDLKDSAQVELQLAIEKRKLASNLWQEAVLRQAAREAELKALDQKKDAAAIREKIKELEAKIHPAPSAVRPTPSAKP